jgi:hypothetical protein
MRDTPFHARLTFPSVGDTRTIGASHISLQREMRC